MHRHAHTTQKVCAFLHVLMHFTFLAQLTTINHARLEQMVLVLSHRVSIYLFDATILYTNKTRKLALVGIIPNQLFSFSSDKDRRTDSRIRRKKHSAAPPRIEPRILRILVARSNHWATKPQRELRVNFRLSPSCQFFFHYEVTRIARVYKHAATNDKSLDLDPFNRKLALVGIIPNQLFSFSSDNFKDRRTDSRIRRKKTQRSPAGNRTQDLILVARSTTWTTELRSHNGNCVWIFDFHQAVSSFSTTRWPGLPESTSTQRPTINRWI